MTDPRRIRRKLLRWYRCGGRDLPWRHTRDPYAILVSEIMLQQTQVDRVVGIYSRWMQRFPDVQKLARAEQRSVIIFWSGLGYNRRALHLHRTSRMIRDAFQGRIPSDVEQLETLPGIGWNTARAVACFAFGIRVPVVDVNIRRVLSRIFWKILSPCRSRPEQEIRSKACEVLPARSYVDWNQALMDLGATICTSVAPSCLSCPVRSDCASREAIPAVSPRGQQKSTAPRSVPRRIHRGRIIERLRSLPRGDAIGIVTLARDIYQSSDPLLLEVLLDALMSLHKDGFVKIQRADGRMDTNERGEFSDAYRCYLAP